MISLNQVSSPQVLNNHISVQVAAGYSGYSLQYLRRFEAAMNKVYSFSLNDDNPREVRAREVINAWISKGLFLRQDIVKALLAISKDNDSWKLQALQTLILTGDILLTSQHHLYIE